MFAGKRQGYQVASKQLTMIQQKIEGWEVCLTLCLICTDIVVMITLSGGWTHNANLQYKCNISAPYIFASFAFFFQFTKVISVTLFGMIM